MTDTDDLLAKLEIIAVQPGDTVIFQAHRPITQDEADDISGRIAKRIDPRIRALVVGSNWTLRVLRPTEEQP